MLELSGGEPLIRQDLPAFVAAANRTGLETRLYSSGVVGYSDSSASPPSAETWAALREAGLGKVFFNLQGPDEEHHSGITRIPGSFEAVKTSIRRAQKAGLFTGIHFVPMRPNFRLLRETVRVARSIGAAEFAILRFVAQGRGRDNREELLLSQEEFSWFLQEATRIRQCSIGLRVRLGCPFNQRILLGDTEDLSLCHAGVEVCHVKSTGDVLPCSAFQQGFLSLGNIRQCGFSELWSSGVALQRFRELRARGPAPGGPEFILESGDSCMVQIASGTERPLDLGFPPRHDAHQVEEAQQD